MCPSQFYKKCMCFLKNDRNIYRKHTFNKLQPYSPYRTHMKFISPKLQPGGIACLTSFCHRSWSSPRRPLDRPQEGGPEGPEAATPLREMRFDGDIKQNYLYVSKRKGIHVRCILKHSTWKTYFHVVRCCWKRKPNSWFLGVFLRTTSSRIYRWYRCNQYPLFDTLCKWIYNIIWLRPLYDMYVMSIRVNRISYGTCLSLSCCEHLTKTNALFL